MALGTITVIDKTQISGTLNHDTIEFTGDSAYAAGGTAGFQALVRKALGKGAITILKVSPMTPQALVPVYNTATDKLQVFSGTSEASAGSQSSTTFRLLVVSK